jgi:predicted molibdopterin-dependent oxidoreductase YjgC
MPQEQPPRVIFLRADAPSKPAEGSACNGCGVCCAAAPCPLGMLLSRRRRGRCRALAWDRMQALYRCGVIDQPQRWLPWLPASWAQGLARRWIAASKGCDSSLTTR